VISCDLKPEKTIILMFCLSNKGLWNSSNQIFKYMIISWININVRAFTNIHFQDL